MSFVLLNDTLQTLSPNTNIVNVAVQQPYFKSHKCLAEISE